jgi:hypothetical protein
LEENKAKISPLSIGLRGVVTAAKTCSWAIIQRSKPNRRNGKRKTAQSEDSLFNIKHTRCIALLREDSTPQEAH